MRNGTDSRGCYPCNEVGHLKAASPKHKRLHRVQPNLSLAVYEVSAESKIFWILDSGSSRQLVSDESWLEDVE